MKIGYIRVSTTEQNTVRQEILMRELAVDELFIDKASGKNLDRPELKRMLEYVRRGKYTGRKPLPLPDNFEHAVSRWEKGELTAAEAMRQTGLKPNTFYRRVAALHTKTHKPCE